MKTKIKQFYIGLEETADLFIKIIKDMGLESFVKAEKVDVDGECELIVKYISPSLDFFCALGKEGER